MSVSGIDHAVGLAVAAQELLQPENKRVAGMPDDDRPDRTAFQQSDTAQDQRAHDALAKVGLLHHQVAEPPRTDDQRLDRLKGIRLDERRPVGKLRQLAQELSGAVSDDRFAALQIAAARHLDLARSERGSGRARRRPAAEMRSPAA